MKRSLGKKIKYITLVCIVSVIIVAVSCGCTKTIGGSEDSAKTNSVITYVSSDSKVYSSVKRGCSNVAEFVKLSNNTAEAFKMITEYGS